MLNITGHLHFDKYSCLALLGFRVGILGLELDLKFGLRLVNIYFGKWLAPCSPVSLTLH